jgi:hypothetical protein
MPDGAVESQAIDLDAGLLLEDRGTRLAWHSSPEELRRLTRPDFCVAPGEHPQTLVLAWNDRVFGGLPCQVTTAFEPGREDLRGVRLSLQYPEAVPSMPAAFRWLGKHLEGCFGRPMYLQDDGEQGEERWDIGSVALRHEYCLSMAGGHYLFIFLRG